MIDRRTLKRIALAIVGAIIIWLLGDLVYSRAIELRLRTWEDSIKRNYLAIQVGHEAFEQGPVQSDESSQNSSTAVLMVHGINDSPHAFKKLARQLAEQGIYCRAIRLPGFAKPMPEYARGTAEHWVQHVHWNVQQLLAEHDRVFVMAHSLGGATAIRMQLKHRTKIDGMILLAPAIEVSNARSPILPTRFWHEVGSRILFFTTLIENPFTIDVRDERERDRVDRCPFSPISVIDETFRLIDSNRGRANEIQVPVLMVLTRNDRVIDHRACERFYEELGSRQKKLVYNDKAGHALPYDFGWEEIGEATIKYCLESSRISPTNDLPSD